MSSKVVQLGKKKRTQENFEWRVARLPKSCSPAKIFEKILKKTNNFFVQG
jgi:hypothetical protein